jgi:hypothetical protein
MLAGEASHGAGLIGALEIGHGLRELQGLFPAAKFPPNTMTGSRFWSG